MGAENFRTLYYSLMHLLFAVVITASEYPDVYLVFSEHVFEKQMLDVHLQTNIQQSCATLSFLKSMNMYAACIQNE